MNEEERVRIDEFYISDKLIKIGSYVSLKNYIFNIIDIYYIKKYNKTIIDITCTVNKVNINFIEALSEYFIKYKWVKSLENNFIFYNMPIEKLEIILEDKIKKLSYHNLHSFIWRNLPNINPAKITNVIDITSKALDHRYKSKNKFPDLYEEYIIANNLIKAAEILAEEFNIEVDIALQYINGFINNKEINKNG